MSSPVLLLQLSVVKLCFFYPTVCYVKVQDLRFCPAGCFHGVGEVTALLSVIVLLFTAAI